MKTCIWVKSSTQPDGSMGMPEACKRVRCTGTAAKCPLKQNQKEVTT